jgi:hypothetical protein
LLKELRTDFLVVKNGFQIYKNLNKHTLVR